MTTSITPAQQAGMNIVSAYKEQELDQASLTAALGNLKGMSPDEALMALLFVMGEHTMVIQQDEVNIDSQNLNMMTTLGQITTQMTNDFNGISPSNTLPASNPQSNQSLAKDLIAQCGNLKQALSNTTLNWTNPVTNASESITWMSPTMASQTLASLASFTSLIGASGPGEGPGSVVATINSWITNPTTGTPTGQQNIQTANSSLATLSNTFSGLSQTASNIVKEVNTILTQYQSALASLDTAYDSQDKAIVANSRGS